MARRAGVLKEGAPAGRSAQLTIKYQARRAPRGCDRRVVYIRYGVPPVTEAEVEIMHQHLEKIARALSGGDFDGEVSQ